MIILQRNGHLQSRSMFNCDDLTKKILIPIHKNSHWMLMTVNFNNKTLEFYDTYHKSGTDIFNKILAYISEEMSFTEREFNRHEWKCISNSQTPRQTDSSRLEYRLRIKNFISTPLWQLAQKNFAFYPIKCINLKNGIWTQKCICPKKWILPKKNLRILEWPCILGWKSFAQKHFALSAFLCAKCFSLTVKAV